MKIINIVNVEDDPTVIHSYTEEAFLDRVNDKLCTNYTINEYPEAARAFLNRYNYLELHETNLVTEYKRVV